MTTDESLDPGTVPPLEKGHQVWSQSVMERLWDKIERKETGCILWKGTYDSNGQPRMYVGNRVYTSAARVAWEIGYGRKLSRRERVYLTCPSGKICVNHEHMHVTAAGRRPHPDHTQIIVQTPPPTDVGVKIQLLLKHIQWSVRNGEQTRAGLALAKKEIETQRQDFGVALARIENAILLYRTELARIVAVLEGLRPHPDLPPPKETELSTLPDPVEPSALAVCYLSVAYEGGNVTADGESALADVLEVALRASDADHEEATMLYLTWLHDYVSVTRETLRSPRDFLRYVRGRME